MKNIKNKLFSKKSRCFIIAEISANHRQDFKQAIELIKRAKECGADSVKFQAYTPDTLTLDMDSRHFRIRHPKWGGQTLYQLYKKTCTPWGWFDKLKRIADDLGIIFFSTVFDKTSVDFLEGIKVPVYKVASFELSDLALIEYVAKTGKPLILSTGMATPNEIKEALNVARGASAGDIMLLKCVSSYPARAEDMNLATIRDMKKRFCCPVGLSDHTLGIGASIAAVSLGANAIEKHFTLSRKVKTADSFFSIEPRELKMLVDNVRIAEKAIGNTNYELTKEEKRNIIFKRSLFAIKDIGKGERITEDNIKAIRPGAGLHPRYLKYLIGKRASRYIKRGTPFNLEFIIQ